MRNPCFLAEEFILFIARVPSLRPSVPPSASLCPSGALATTGRQPSFQGEPPSLLQTRSIARSSAAFGRVAKALEFWEENVAGTFKPLGERGVLVQKCRLELSPVVPQLPRGQLCWHFSAVNIFASVSSAGNDGRLKSVKSLEWIFPGSGKRRPPPQHREVTSERR